MSYNQYSGYGGNPYGNDGQAGGYGEPTVYRADTESNPYGGGGGYGQVSCVELDSVDISSLTATMRSTMEVSRHKHL